MPAEPAARVEMLLARIVEALDLDAEVLVEEGEDEIAARVEGEDLGLLIGRRGQTIDAVQLLCYRVAFRGREDRKRVSVDAAGYRERRRETIERQAERAAERALETGKEIELEPMSPARAQDRPRPAQGPLRDRDLQRGRGARALRDRRSAGRGLTELDLRGRLEPVLELLAADPALAELGPRPERAWSVHVADSLSGLELVGDPRGSPTSAPAPGFRGSRWRLRCRAPRST